MMHFQFFKRLSICLAVVFCIAASAKAQNFTISGTLKDASSGEDLIGASVVLKEKPTVGAVTNLYGFYSLTLPQGTHTLVYRSVGLTTVEEVIVLKKDTTINKELGQNSLVIKEVVVNAVKEDENVTRNEMSVVRIDPSNRNTPVSFGEPDVIKLLQMSTPGIKSAGDGNAGFYVRGGSIDQNLIILDEAPVYNASHLLGFFSVFNSDALKDVTMYKGTMPAEYGGRGASVLDIRMKEGNSKKLTASGGIGIIASRLTIEAPINKGKGSFIVSARRTYADLFLKLSSDQDIKNTQLFFYDLNAKGNYRLGAKDKIFVSGYLGRDILKTGGIGLNWGNYTGTLRWNHIFNDKLFSNTSLIYSNFDYQFGVGGDANAVSVKASINDINFKQDFNYYPNPRNTIKFGLNVIHHTFLPTSLEASEDSPFTPSVTEDKFAYEGGAYIQNDWKATDRLAFQYGLRYSYFNYIGKGTAYTFDENGTKIGETRYESGESIQQYGGFEPRLNANYLLNTASSLKASYTRNRQYLHLLTNATTSSPTDLWVPSTNNVKPQIVDQVSLGYFRNFADNAYEFSAETYYKDLQNQIDYRNGADLVFNSEYEGALTYGSGRAYGTELFVRKKKGAFTGSVSYTLSRTERKFAAINNGDYYPARQDRTHDLSIISSWQARKRLNISANWIYYTGDAATFPSGKYYMLGKPVPYYTERNGYRIPNYHRLDLGVTLMNKERKNFESSWTFSLYNAYGRQNTYSIAFQQNEDDPQRTEAVQTALFRWIPSVTYNFKFK